MKKNKANLFNFFSNKELLFFLIIALLLLLISLLEVISISSIPIFANYYFKKENSILLDEKYFSLLDSYISLESLSVIIILIFLIKNSVAFLINVVQNKFIKQFLIKIAVKLHKNILERNYLYFSKVSSSLIVRNLSHDIDQVGIFLNSSMTLLKEFLIVCFFLILIIKLGLFQGILFLFSIALILFLIFRTYKKNIDKISKKFQILKAKHIKHLNDERSLIQEIKIYLLYDFYNKNFKKIQTQLENLKFLKNIIVATPRLIIEVIFIIFFICLLYILTKFFNTDEIFELVILLSIISIRFIPIYGSISSSFITMRTTYPSINMLVNELSVSSFKSDKKIFKNKELITKKNINNHKKSFLYLHNLNFSFTKNKKIIKRFNYIILKKDFVGILGPSGSGKTTLLNIICGLIAPNSGNIYHYGKSIYLDLDNWKKKIGYVSSSSIILNSSLIENVVLEKEINKKKIIKILKLLNMEKFINNLHFKLGDNGSALSSGQKQRILIARVLYRDPELLIFDEVTNFLDSKNEANVIKLIRNLNKIKPVIFISHKKENLKYCNKIINFN
jgi:ABC-type multidrug transport system fused ATPase/permease subunit